MNSDDELARQAQVRRLREGVRLLELSTRDYIANESRRTGLGQVDIHAIGILRAADGRGKGVSVGELGRELSISPPATSALVRRLEKAGHVRRCRSGLDGRSIRLEPTSSAHLTSHAMFRDMLTCYDEVFAGYSADELGLAADIIERLDRSTRAYLGRTRADVLLGPPDED